MPLRVLTPDVLMLLWWKVTQRGKVSAKDLIRDRDRTVSCSVVVISRNGQGIDPKVDM